MKQYPRTKEIAYSGENPEAYKDALSSGMFLLVLFVYLVANSSWLFQLERVYLNFRL